MRMGDREFPESWQLRLSQWPDRSYGPRGDMIIVIAVIVFFPVTLLAILLARIFVKSVID